MVNNYGWLSYSFFNILAYSAAGYLFYLQAKERKDAIDSLSLMYIILGALLGALLGSRLGSALFVYRDFYAQHPSALLYPQVGGKTVIGGLIGGYMGVEIAKKILKVRRSTGDLFAPGLALGIAIGRIGCFLNGCCYGIETNLPWAVMYKGVFRHPTQLYEAIFCFWLFFGLWLKRRSVTKEGDLFKLFLIWYCFFRFFVEFLRADRVYAVFGLSLAQVISSAVFCLLAVYFLKQSSSFCHK